MITLASLKFKPTYFVDKTEPEQNTAVAVETADQMIQSGVWECGPGVLHLHFRWSESVYILDGYAEVTNLETNEVFTLKKETIALFERGSKWSWYIPWKLKKVFTILDLEDSLVVRRLNQAPPS